MAEYSKPDIKKIPGGFEITRKPCVRCGEPPFGDEYACGHSQQPPARRALTESERTTITNGLRVAAESFKKHAAEFRAEPSTDAYRQLAETFEKERDASIAMARLIDDADSVEVIS
jgi:hypothetical protein